MTICSFTDRYKQFDWLADGKESVILNFTHLSSCSRYCDEEAAAFIRSAISQVPLTEQLYLDNGNYHYVSYFRAELIKEEFDLLLIDHHTDAQEPQFPLLSCGSWVLECLRNNEHMKEVYMIGPPEEKLSDIPAEYLNRIHLIDPDAENNILQRADKNRALFVSVDLDVLSPDSFDSVWDQGDMLPETLKKILRTISREERICAIDICG